MLEKSNVTYKAFKLDNNEIIVLYEIGRHLDMIQCTVLYHSKQMRSLCHSWLLVFM